MVPRGKVVTFEALPYYARVLHRTIQLLGCRNVQIVNQAVCDAEKPIHMVWKNSQGKRLTGLTHILGPQESSATTITVPGTTLDSFFAANPGNVRFLKMDIEGAELAALRGAQRLFAEQRPLVYTELNASHCARYGYTPQEIFDYYGSRNYQGFIAGSNDGLEPVGVAEYANSGKQNVWFVPQEEIAAFVSSAAA
jgi:FkbM family methyltransferase